MSAEKMFIGLQFVMENIDDVINSPYVVKGVKYKLVNLKSQVNKVQLSFWSNLDNDAELYFQNRIKEIERILRYEED